MRVTTFVHDASYSFFLVLGVMEATLGSDLGLRHTFSSGEIGLVILLVKLQIPLSPLAGES